MTSSPTPAVLPDARALVTKMVEDRKSQLSSCERMLELLQPEWDKFQARTGHDTYVARDYAEHTSAARKHRTEIAALEAVMASNLNGYIDGYEDALEVAAPPASDAAVPAGEPFGYWIEHKYAEPVFLRGPAYDPEPSDLRVITPLYAAAPKVASEPQLERIKAAVSSYREAPFRSAEWLAGELITILDTEAANG